MSEQDLVPQDVNLPAERIGTGKGLGNIDQEDRIIPRLKIMQPLSPEVDEELARPGSLLNSVSKRDYGKQISFVPIFWWKSRIYWAKREEGGEIICSAKDAINGTVLGKCGDCQHSKWTEEHPACTAVINILGLTNNEIIAISFMKTSYQAGKQLINLFNYKKADIFNFSYELYTEQEENNLGKYYVLKFRDRNAAVEDAVYQKCSVLFDDFALLKEKVAVEQE